MSDRAPHRLTVRRILAAIAAYLMLLHTVAMGAMAAEPVELDAGLFVICSTHSGGSSVPAPSDHGAQHPPCALCGLGHCAIAVPPGAALRVDFATTAVVEIPATTPVAVPTRYLDASRPRGPPLAA
jgi:hypothetical protein